MWRAVQRKQFGRAIAEFQGLQFMLADMAMKIEAARQLTYAAAAKSEGAMQDAREPDLTFISSACKCYASDVAMDVTTDAVQLLGGYGYVRDYPVERMMRDAKITQIYEGTNQIQCFLPRTFSDRARPRLTTFLQVSEGGLPRYPGPVPACLRLACASNVPAASGHAAGEHRAAERAAQPLSVPCAQGRGGVYAKADVAVLRVLARPWPGGAR
jgi:Acyl-CoA dehydrogenase, C-terminal domain